MASDSEDAKNNSSTSETVKWIMGIFATLFMLSVKMSIDTYTETQNTNSKKIDKVYDFASDHELRIRIVEQQMKDNAVRLNNLEDQFSRGQFYLPDTRNSINAIIKTRQNKGINNH